MRAVLLVFVVACTSGGSEPIVPTWKPLVTKSWTLPPGGEKTSDIELVDLDRDIYVGGIRPIAPVGTHHTLLAHGSGLAGDVIYASGVGTNELTFPPGVGLKLSAGNVVVLQLHTFNTSDAPLSGVSGVEVLEVDPSNVVDEAELMLAGPTELAIPPGPQTLTSTCTVRTPQTVFALFPHMHQLGMHFKTTLVVGGTERVVHDAPYSFEEQPFLPLEPVTLEVGDSIKTECTWFNPTSSTVRWGESSTTEMCFSILYRYPLVAQLTCST